MQKEERNEQILLDIVEEYIKTAEPISSQQLLKKYKYNLSSATIRNIMSELDEADFLYQPHTSAGRVPTRKAYRFFVDKVELGTRKMPSKEKTKERFEFEFKKDISRAFEKSPDVAAHMLSRHLAEMTNSMAFAGLLRINHFYKEGLRYLLDEPEFVDTQNIRNLIEYTDSLENKLEKLYKAIQDDVRVYVGGFSDKEQPAPFSLVVFASELPHAEKMVFGIIGPMRMQYYENIELLNEIRNLFG